MDFLNRQVLVTDSFYQLELSSVGKIAFVIYKGTFDIEQYKASTLKVLDLFEEGSAFAVIADHRQTDPLPREAQKWFVHDLTNIIKTRFGKKMESLVFVVLINQKDQVRKAIAGFLVYMMKLFIGVKCYHAGNMEEALSYCGFEPEMSN